jgi:DHA2 family multidrug resistance protein
VASTGFFDRFGIPRLGIPRFGSLSLSSLGDRVLLRPPVSPHPLVGITAVLLGAFIVTLGGRVTTFGLNDVRGAIHAGVDEGAWITTANTVGQMLICAPTVWMGNVFGPRRILLVATLVLMLSSLLLPATTTLQGVLIMQFVGGLAMGTFLPLTISFVVRNLPPRYLIYGIAAYAMNLELSQNISASLEGFYLDHWSWKWIFWQNAVLALPMWVTVYVGIPRRPADFDAARGVERTGMIYYSLGFSLLYAALDQGNRLDWLNDGLICGLLLAGGLLLFAFVLQEMTSETPWLDLRIIVRSNVGLLVIMLIFLRFSILSTSYIIPQFLTTVQGYRALQVGDVLLSIALPQVLLAPLIGTALRVIDPRTTLALGFTLIGYACFSVSSGLTAQWGSDDFMPSQILQAFGQSLALTSLVAYNLRLLRPEDALTFGTILQTARLFGGEAGTSFMQTYVRVREQVHSHLLGLHVTAESGGTVDRLTQYEDLVRGSSAGTVDAAQRAVLLLARTVQAQSYVLAYIDGFVVIGFGTIICLGIILFLRHALAPR